MLMFSSSAQHRADGLVPAKVRRRNSAGVTQEKPKIAAVEARNAAELAQAVDRARERYVRGHRQGSMATVSAIILFDALRRDLATSDRRSITAFSRQQLRDAMAAHPAWEGKAFEESSFNTVPEDLGEQLEQFVHEDYVGGRKTRIRFRGPTRQFRED